MSEKKVTNLTKISLRTEPNGYSLSVDGEEFFYFNELDLLAGFCAHVGACDNTPMDKGSILNSLFAAMIGETYTNSVTALKKRVAMLTDQYENRISKLDETLEFAAKAFETVDGLSKKAESINQRLQAVSEGCSTLKQKVADTKSKWVNLETYVNNVVDAAIKAADGGKSKSKDSSKVETKKDDTKAAKKPKSRAARDQEIIEKLKAEGQLKD